MKRSNWIRTDRLWCLFLVIAVSGITGSSSKNIDLVKLPLPTKESLPKLAEVLKATAYLEDDNDELEKNFEGQRNTYKRLPRKLGNEEFDLDSETQEYKGVMGRPGVDFPIMTYIPRTDFSCKKVKKPGYYADPETDCQVFHICDNGRKVSFLCPNGTIFRQSHLICDWWFRVDCERSTELYEESAEQLATDQRKFKERHEALSKAMLKVQTTQRTDERVVTERSFGPSTTIFNSESLLPDRSRYFSGYSKDENQVPAETGSFVGNQFQTNSKNYYPQSKTPLGNWNQDNFQSGNYQTQSSTVQPTWNQDVNNNYQSSTYQAQSTTALPIWNQAVNSNYQSSTYQVQSTTTAQPTWNQAINNNYQSGSYQTQSPNSQSTNVQSVNNLQSRYQPQYTTIPQSVHNQGVTSSQVVYQQPLSNNIYQSGNYQTAPTTAAPQTNRNNQGVNGYKTDNYQTYTPTTTQINWNQGGSSSSSSSYQTPSTTLATQNNWNNQGTNNYQTESHQTSPTTTSTTAQWSNEEIKNFNSDSYQKQATNTIIQPNWNQAVNNLQSNNYQSQPATTIQPDWSQEYDTNQPILYQSQQSYQQPTTVLPTDYEPTIPAKESQVLAESASIIGHQNSPNFNFQPANYYTQGPQTNPPQTSYPVTSSYPNEFSPSGAFSFVEYQRSPNTPIFRDNPTQSPPLTTTISEYTTVRNSTLPPSGETLIPNMINSLQTLSDNNLLFDLDGQSPYPLQSNTDDDLNSVAVYFNNIKSQQVSTVASDLQFNYFEQTSSANTNSISSVGIESVETTTPIAENIPAVLTKNTKEAYDKLFKNDTNLEAASTTVKPIVVETTPSPTSSVNLSFAQGLYLNRSSAELRELAAVFTRALTAYLDDPENFRKILAEVRPTEPPSVKTSVTEEQEVLDFSDDSKIHKNKPAVSSTTSNTNLAVEINGMTQGINALTDLSTVVPQYTTSPLIEITSKLIDSSNSGLHEYAPLDDSEQLQVAGSQSFYSSRGNSIETAKTLKPATSTSSWTVSPSVNQQETRTTTPTPEYYTTNAGELEANVIVQRAKEMFSHLNVSEAGMLMNVMKTADANDTVKRLVLLLVNDPNKENSPEQTRNHIIEALLEHKTQTIDQVYSASSPNPTFLPSTTPTKIPVGNPVRNLVEYPGGNPVRNPNGNPLGNPVGNPIRIPFGQRLQDDGSPIQDGQQYKRSRKGSRRVVVHRSRSIPTSTTLTPLENTWQQRANDVGAPGLSADSDNRAVELLKSIYSIASKWS